MMYRFQIPKEEDYAGLAEIINASQEPFRRLDHVEYGEMETVDTIAEMEASRELLCAYHGETVVGVIAFRQKNKQTIWVSSLFVDPPYQGKGIGGALLREVEDWGKNKGALVCTLETDPRALWACDFYVHQGYQILTDKHMSCPPWDMVLDKPQVVGRYVFGKKIATEYEC